MCTKLFWSSVAQTVSSFAPLATIFSLNTHLAAWIKLNSRRKFYFWLKKWKKRIKNETYETYRKLGIFQILNEFCTYFKLDSILSPSAPNLQPPATRCWKSLRGKASFPRSVVVGAGVDVSLLNSTFNFWPGGATTTASKKYKKKYSLMVKLLMALLFKGEHPRGGCVSKLINFMIYAPKLCQRLSSIGPAIQCRPS